MNTAEVQEAFHVDGTVYWESCSTPVSADSILFAHILGFRGVVSYRFRTKHSSHLEESYQNRLAHVGIWRRCRRRYSTFVRFQFSSVLIS